MNVFYKYAQYYDLIYNDKDYDRECSIIEQIFSKYSDIKVTSILDLGCGTGEHATLLAKRGYKVTGVDLSQEMLQIAISKKPFTDNPDFHLGNIRDVSLNQEFDAVICMFAVLGYQAENDNLIAVLNNVYRHLKKGGVFIFDCWYGPAVLNIKPSARIKKIRVTDSLELIRYADSFIDVNANLVKVCYDLLAIENNLVRERVSETHRMRYFFLPEIMLMLQTCGLTFIQAYDFNDLSKNPSANSWNIICIAKK